MVAGVKIKFLPMSQISNLKEDEEVKTCLCCGGYADGAVLDEDKVIAPCNSMCFFLGKAESCIEETIVKEAEVAT